jgi:hypothetical protein
MKTVDPYCEWLGIAAKDQPPDQYRPLGLELSEENPHGTRRGGRYDGWRRWLLVLER